MQATKSELVQWINTNLPNVNLTKIEQLGSGSVYCQLMNLFCPNIIPAAKINLKAKTQVENILNFKQIQNSFNKVGIKKTMDIDRLSRHVYLDNFEFTNFLINYLESNKERLTTLKFNDKISPKNVTQKNKENKNQIQNQNPPNEEMQQQMNELEQLKFQKNELRQILMKRGVDNIDKLKQIDQLFVFSLTPYKDQKLQEVQSEPHVTTHSKRLFLSQPREKDDEQNQGLAEEFDLTQFDSLQNQPSEYKSLYLEGRELYSVQEQQQQNNLSRQSGHFQLIGDEEPLLMSKTGSQCKSNHGYTFRKEEQIQTPKQTYQSSNSMASSQRKILNLQHESQNKQANYKDSPHFSQAKVPNQNIIQNQKSGIQNEENSFALGSSIQNQYSMEPNAQSSSNNEAQSSNKETRREVQSLPVSKNKYMEIDTIGVNQSVGKGFIQHQVCIQTSGGGKMIEE